MIATILSGKNRKSTFRKNKRPIRNTNNPLPIKAHWYGDEKPSAGKSEFFAIRCPAKNAGE